MDETLVEIARQAMREALAEGMDETDAKWMAQGAVMREGRTRGIIGEELTPEMQAAIEQVVKEAKVKAYNAEMDARNRAAVENRERPWLPGEE